MAFASLIELVVILLVVNTFEVVLVLVTEVLLSSGFDLVALCFIRSWASAFSLSQPLKSSRVV